MMGQAISTTTRAAGPYRLTLPATLGARALALQFLGGICRAADVSCDVEHALVSALGEAFNNIVVHSYRHQAGDVRIEVEARPARITVRLYDRGAGFDPRAVRAPDLDALPEGGLGVFIILRAMDEVRWFREGAQNVMVMVKRVPRPGHTT